MVGQRVASMLIRAGVLDEAQVLAAAAEQERRPGVLFGRLTAEMFAIDERDIWRAIGAQIVNECPRVDLGCEPWFAGATELVTPREAWVYHLLPLRCEAGGLVCATTAGHLPDAMALIQPRRREPVRFVLAEARQLEGCIMSRFALRNADVQRLH
jgi:hypothetical protein